ncbi:hypothetical protein FIBSPDRAFT_878161, partial [Athelia psychrophila]
MAAEEPVSDSPPIQTYAMTMTLVVPDVTAATTSESQTAGSPPARTANSDATETEVDLVDPAPIEDASALSTQEAPTNTIRAAK